MFKGRKLRRLALGVTLAAALAATAGAEAAQSDTTNITIGYVQPIGICALAQIALNQNYFPSNLNVSLKLIPGSTILPALATGSIQFAIAGAPIIDEGVAASASPLKYLAEWNDPPDNQFVVRPGINTIQDMAGKNVAISSPGTLSAILTNAAIHIAGGDKVNINLISAGALSATIGGFAAGTFSGALVSPPTTQQLLSQVPGSKVLVDFNKVKNFPWIGMGIAGYMPWVTSHPAATVEVLQALNKALVWSHQKANAAAVQQVIASFTGLTNASDIQAGYQSLDDNTTPQLQAVPLATEQNILQFLRFNQIADAKASLAPTLITSVYIDKALGIKATPAKKTTPKKKK